MQDYGHRFRAVGVLSRETPTADSFSPFPVAECDGMKFVLGCALALTLMSGCGVISGKGTVKGKVTFKGEPLPAGRVTFISKVEGRNDTQSCSIKDGLYEIKDFPTGNVQILVETFRPSADSEKKTSSMPKDLGIRPQQMESVSSPPGKYVKIPDRYSSFEKSDLTYTVTRGEQEYDIPLTE